MEVQHHGTMRPTTQRHAPYHTAPCTLPHSTTHAASLHHERCLTAPRMLPHCTTHAASQTLAPQQSDVVLHRYLHHHILGCRCGAPAPPFILSLAGVQVSVVWITRRGAPPYSIIENDPLPQRAELYVLGHGAQGSGLRAQGPGLRAKG